MYLLNSDRIFEVKFVYGCRLCYMNKKKSQINTRYYYPAIWRIIVF